MPPFEDLAPSLTLDEQARLTGGEDDWHTPGLPERGIPRLKMTDGPVGARGESYTTTTSASFPCGAALGATFDPAVVARVAKAIADEARAKGAHVLLGPTLNLVRHPLGGRNFETYSEDPLLTAHLAVAFVQALQERGVAACAKHLVANDAEIERLTISSVVDERTLREAYLLPFEAAVRDGGAWSVMASYNRLNGTFACEHEWLLTTVLKDEWGFDGVVVSDWFAAHDTVRCAKAGLDVEMPGPAHHFGTPLAEAVRRGDLRAARVSDQAVRILRLADRVGAVAGEEPVEQSHVDPDRWAVARDAAAAAMVLLRNEPVDGVPVLPFDPERLERVAVIGPNADVLVVQGGGSARVAPHRVVSPLAGLRERLGDGVEIVYQPGTGRHHLPVLNGQVARADGRPGVRVEYRDVTGGDVRFAHSLPQLDPVWSGRFSPSVDPQHFHVTASATLVSERTGEHELSLVSVGPCRVFVDGQIVLETPDDERGSSLFGFGTHDHRARVALTEGEAHALTVDYARPRRVPLAGYRLGLQPPLGDDPLGEAAAAAAGSDVAVVVVGTDDAEETEGRDRLTMALAGDQDELVRRVVAANPRTVVVVNAGAPVDLPWANQVPAVLQLWFPGMAGGEALARVLVGDDEPGGRLPVTFPADLGEVPCDISQADPPGELRYTEGLHIGHRWYLSNDRTPRYWFGHGLGYATFSWGEPSASASSWSAAAGALLAVSIDLTNTSARDGAEVVQVYARRPASSVDRPAWVLAGLAKVTVPAGASRAVDVEIDPRALRHWDGGWHVEPGPLELRVARSAGDPGQLVTVEVT